MTSARRAVFGGLRAWTRRDWWHLRDARATEDRARAAKNSPRGWVRSGPRRTGLLGWSEPLSQSDAGDSALRQQIRHLGSGGHRKQTGQPAVLTQNRTRSVDVIRCLSDSVQQWFIAAASLVTWSVIKRFTASQSSCWSITTGSGVRSSFLDRIWTNQALSLFWRWRMTRPPDGSDNNNHICYCCL